MMTDAPAGRSFSFAFDPGLRRWARRFGVLPTRSFVTLDRRGLEACFGPWRLATPWSNVTSIERTGPYTAWKVAGPAHLSLAGRGLTFSATTAAGACLQFRRPERGLDPLGIVRHPAVTLGVDDLDEFIALARQFMAAAPPASGLDAPTHPRGGFRAATRAIWRWSRREGSVEHRQRVVGQMPPPAQESTDDAQPIEGGTGPGYHRRYRITVHNAQRSLDEVVNTLLADPSVLTDVAFSPFTKLQGELGATAVGDRYLVEIAGPWKGAVEVVARDPRCLRMALGAGRDCSRDCGQLAVSGARGPVTSRRAQPSLFGDEDPQPIAEPEAPLPGQDAETVALAARLPADLRLGTSSWSFPGWAGLVYGRERSVQSLARDGLRDYARHPLLRPVGIDRSYYAPIPESDLERYASQLSDGYLCCLKAPATATSLVVPESARTAHPALNPLFLSADHLTDDLLAPLARAFGGHTGVVILELPPAPRELRLEPAAFVDRLDACLGALPRDFRYAVKLRDRRFLTRAYGEVLRTASRTLTTTGARCRPLRRRRRPSRSRQRRLPSCACCCGPARATRTSARPSVRSTALSRPTRRCEPTSSTSCIGPYARGCPRSSSSTTRRKAPHR